eukprot:811293-Heterocapsa_arctica.AAC.1
MTTRAVWYHRLAKSSPMLSIRQAVDTETPSTHSHIARRDFAGQVEPSNSGHPLVTGTRHRHALH